MQRLFKCIICLIIISLIVGCGTKGKEKLYTIGVSRFSSTKLSDESVQGVSDALTEAGYINGKNCYIDYKNAQGDFSSAQSIAQKFVNDKVDIIITFTTPCLQVTASVNKIIPHVFGAVTDPFRMGIAEDQEHHQSNITGLATFQPVDETIELIITVLPETKNVGVIWNPAEACSEACTEMIKKSLKSRSLILTEVTVTNSSEVLTAARCLAMRGADVIFISGDNTVLTALDTVVAVGEDNDIPVVTNNPSNTEKGALFSLGADYYVVGKETGKLAVRVIKGEKPADIPIQKLVPKKLWLSNKVARNLKIVFPEKILKKADKIIE